MCERERSIYRRRERARDRIFILLLTPYAIHLPMIMEPFARRGSARRSLFLRRVSAASQLLRASASDNECGVEQPRFGLLSPQTKQDMASESRCGKERNRRITDGVEQHTRREPQQRRGDK
mgnify:FL=1